MSAEDRYQIGSAPDWRGNPIAPGSTVLYPRQSGHSVEMAEATVLEVWRQERDRTTFNWDAPREERYGKAAQYVFKLKPKGRGSRSFGSGLGKPVWIQNGENVTAV